MKRKIKNGLLTLCAITYIMCAYAELDCNITYLDTDGIICEFGKNSNTLFQRRPHGKESTEADKESTQTK